MAAVSDGSTPRTAKQGPPLSASCHCHSRLPPLRGSRVMPDSVNGVLVSSILKPRHLLQKDSRGFFVLRVSGRRISGKIGFGTLHRVIRCNSSAPNIRACGCFVPGHRNDQSRAVRHRLQRVDQTVTECSGPDQCCSMIVSESSCQYFGGTCGRAIDHRNQGPVRDGRGVCSQLLGCARLVDRIVDQFLVSSKPRSALNVTVSGLRKARIMLHCTSERRHGVGMASNAPSRMASE
jgi:hypothetical protein